ncbi:MAG: HDOD domain-containing protein [Burkholderiaceae bacterium]|nr:HDOD domain-containing protein [Sulfuritalea sp.]MCF8175930.1 HDOD domain-containing protein [Burkholderiaceae bacterium]MCF8184981.1 HDOD domain-containing protein [Polynucleobacter sp.]
MNPSLTQIVDSLHSLPSLPMVVMELLQTMGEEDVNIERLAQGIGNDQALAARTLRVANSPFYGMQGKIDTIAEAITVLGFVNVRSLVTTAGIASTLRGNNTAGFEAQIFWRHCLGVASCAATLGPFARLRPETLFLAGLLHDIGRLVLVSTHPATFAEIQQRHKQNDCLPVDAEREVLGFDHAQIGGELCRHWRIPASIADAVERHHQVNPQATGKPADMADLVHLADVIAHSLDLTHYADAMVPPPDDAAWRRLGLGATDLRAVLKKAELQFNSFANILV